MLRWSSHAAILFALSAALSFAPASGQAEEFSLTFDQSQYEVRQPIVIQTTCPAPSSSAWVGLFEAGASSQSYLDYKYVNSEEGCRLEFDGRDNPGQFEARYFPDSGYVDQLRVPFGVVTDVAATGSGGEHDTGQATATGSQDVQSNVVAVATESGLAFDKASYRIGEKIRVTFDCSVYEKDSWVGIFDPSDSARDYGTYKADWLYIRDRKDCRFAFSPRSFAGTYEARIVAPSGDYIAVRQAFEVVEGGSEAGGIALAKPDYTTHEPIVVTTPCATGGSSDWIALFKAGVSSYSYGSQGKDWYYMKQGTREGDLCSFSFAARTETGKYEVRQFHDNDYTAYAQQGFEIAKTGVQPEPVQKAKATPGIRKPLWISLTKTDFAVGEPITVAVKCHDKSYPARDPWIGLRLVSEPIQSHPQRSETGATFQQGWFYLKNYTQPGDACVYQFPGRSQPGSYEVRVFRTIEDCDCSDNLAGRLAFTVNGGGRTVAAVDSGRRTELQLTEATSRYKDYDYVRANATDCVTLVKNNSGLLNRCDYPVSVYLTRKLGYEDRPMQAVENLPAKAEAGLAFEHRGTVSWLACHESQTLCQRALACMADMQADGRSVLGYVTAECSAFEK